MEQNVNVGKDRKNISEIQEHRLQNMQTISIGDILLTSPISCSLAIFAYGWLSIRRLYASNEDSCDNSVPLPSSRTMNKRGDETTSQIGLSEQLVTNHNARVIQLYKIQVEKLSRAQKEKKRKQLRH